MNQSGGVAVPLHLLQQAVGLSVYYVVGCISTLEFSAADELARSPRVWGSCFFYSCSLPQVLTSATVLESLLCQPVLPSAILCLQVHTNWRQRSLKTHPWATEARLAHFLHRTTMAQALKIQRLLCRARYTHRLLVFTSSKITALSRFPTIPSSSEKWEESMRI